MARQIENGTLVVITSPVFIAENGYIVGTVKEFSAGYYTIVDNEGNTYRNSDITPVVDLLKLKDSLIRRLSGDRELLKSILTTQGVRIVTKGQAKQLGISE